MSALTTLARMTVATPVGEVAAVTTITVGGLGMTTTIVVDATTTAVATAVVVVAAAAAAVATSTVVDTAAVVVTTIAPATMTAATEVRMVRLLSELGTVHTVSRAPFEVVSPLALAYENACCL